MCPDVFTAEDVGMFRDQIAAAFARDTESVRQREGAVYAVRNVLRLFPDATRLWQKPMLRELLSSVLGSEYGLIRGLFFDKPPDQTWALPWHKDLLIAVQNDRISSSLYSPPRLRIGVPHTEPPLEVLQSMLTLRIHLDDMTAENGPLEVLPESHLTGKTLQIHGFRAETLQCRAGDVLAMRPLLVHSSGRSLPEVKSHRRILHLEFCGLPELPDGVRWNEWYPPK